MNTLYLRCEIRDGVTCIVSDACPHTGVLVALRAAESGAWYDANGVRIVNLDEIDTYNGLAGVKVERPLHSYRDDDGMLARVWPSASWPGRFNVTLHDVDSGERAGAHVGLATEADAIATAMRWTGK